MSGVFMQGLEVEGAPPQTPGQRPITAFRVTTPGYFGALGDSVAERAEHFKKLIELRQKRVVVIDRTTRTAHGPKPGPGQADQTGCPQDPLAERRRHRR
jgi:hypothetical protein